MLIFDTVYTKLSIVMHLEYLNRYLEGGQELFSAQRNAAVNIN